MADNKDIICSCLDITRGEIIDCIKGGAESLTAIQEKNEAGTVCGSCIDDIKEIMREQGLTDEQIEG